MSWNSSQLFEGQPHEQHRNALTHNHESESFHSGTWSGPAKRQRRLWGSYISGMTPLSGDELDSHGRLAATAMLTEGKAAVQRRAAATISKWHVGYHCHTNSASLARIFRELPNWTLHFQEDNETSDEGTWDSYLWKGPIVGKLWMRQINIPSSSFNFSFCFTCSVFVLLRSFWEKCVKMC